MKITSVYTPPAPTYTIVLDGNEIEIPGNYNELRIVGDLDHSFVNLVDSFKGLNWLLAVVEHMGEGSSFEYRYDMRNGLNIDLIIKSLLNLPKSGA